MGLGLRTTRIADTRVFYVIHVSILYDSGNYYSLGGGIHALFEYVHRRDRMNPIQALQKQIQTNFPSVDTEMDSPRDYDNGRWFLDIPFGEKKIVVEWKQSRGFCLAVGADGFQQDTEEYFQDLASILTRLTELLSA